ncbi:hypothetical protein D3C72_1619470 [compost metagenome]
MQVLDRPGNPHRHVDPCGDPGARRTDLTVAGHETIVHRYPRRTFSGAEGCSRLVKQIPILDPVAAGEDELGFGHRNRRRVHRHCAQILDARKTARHGCG